MFKSYDAFQFESLPDFELARARPARIVELARLCGDVLWRYGCQEALGVALLHKHFDLAPHERLVRTNDDPKREHAVPMTIDAAGDALPWLWRFSRGAAGPGWYPVEYVRASPAARGLYTVFEKCEHVFDDLARVLLQNELEGVFGIAADYANDGLQIEAHEQLVENSEVDPRRLALHVAPRDSSDGSDATITLYRWSESSTHK
jgi:hypothetical protein